jgi:cytochrome c oxidase cbb3-type subunit 3
MKTSILLIPALAGATTLLFAQVPKKEAKAGGESAETIFKRQCAGCHGPDAKGQTAMGKTFKLRDLTSDEVQKDTDSQLFDIIAKGKGKMPAFESNLGQDRIDSLVAYLRGLEKK